MNRYVLAGAIALASLASTYEPENLSYEARQSDVAAAAADVRHQARVEAATRIAEARP